MLLIVPMNLQIHASMGSQYKWEIGQNDSPPKIKSASIFFTKKPPKQLYT